MSLYVGHFAPANMMTLLDREYGDQPFSRRGVPRSLVFAWGLCGVALLHTALLFTISDPRAPLAIAIRMLQPLVSLGALVLLLGAAWRQHGSRRYAWLLQAIAVLIVGTTALIRIGADAQGSTPPAGLLEVLYPLAYACALVGLALYLPRRSLWVGNTLQIVLDNVAVGWAVLVLLQSLLPALVQSWPWSQAAAAARYLAFDVAVCYTLGIMCLRYRRGGGPLIALAFLSVLCLVLADTLFLLLSWIPGGARWHLVEGPLYTLQAVLLASGANRSVRQPPRLRDPAPALMPADEWLLWTLVPRALLLAVIAVAIDGAAPPPRATLAALLALSIARELLATYDLRRAQIAQAQAQAQAQASARQTENFLARIIHDTAAPLQGAQSAAARLDQTADPLAGMVRTHIDHLGQLFRQLQIYLHTRTVPLRCAPLDVVPLCVAAIDAAQEAAAARQLSMRMILDTDQPLAYAEVVAVRRVLDNLLANAIRATPPGGTIVMRVSAPPASPELLLEVRDSGPGIAPEDHVRIFAPLMRLHGGSGLGLGLAIVQETVRLLHGSCGVDSRPRAGSTFWVRLPRLSPDDRRSAGEPTDTASPNAGSSEEDDADSAGH